MGTSLTASTLTVTHTESISINGVEYGGTNTMTIASIAEVSKRIVSIPTTEQTILSFSDKIAAGTFVEGNVKYIRITNKDDTNHVYLVFKNEYNNECCMKLDKGQTFLYNPDLTSGVIDTMLANQVALGFAETTGDLANSSDNVTGITANGAIIPGLRVRAGSGQIPAASSVGAVTGAANGVSAATAHTLVTRHATTGAETASNATGDTDNDQTYSAGFGDLVEITAEADTAAVDLEIFVANT